jgi:hypothetical protein
LRNEDSILVTDEGRVLGTDVRRPAFLKAKSIVCKVEGQELTLSREVTPAHPEEPKPVKVP